mmetsp:Transcript_44917/g.105410  ORF Transcript_44917/g.105410 Transcript_44917/m.105410 type:complete len:364 (-) Transcript_44917:188-1279(-)
MAKKPKNKFAGQAKKEGAKPNGNAKGAEVEEDAEPRMGRGKQSEFKLAEEMAQQHMEGESDSEEEQDHVTSKQVGSQGGRLAAMQQAQRDMGGNKMVEDRPAGSVGGGFRNKQRVLIIASRGITHRFRHLMLDIGKLLPHGTKDAKMESKDRPSVINEIAEMRGCNSALYFEARKHKDLYLWVARTPLGPSAKFLVQNIHTAGELKFTGNHLLFSRPFLVFDAAFDSEPHLQLLKEMFQQTFGTPKGHRKSKPFVDHTLAFYVLDGHIWVRNYQIAKTETTGETALVEVGPRFCLQLHRIFAGAFQGATIYSNVDYISPNVVRSREKLAKSAKYAARTEAQRQSNLRKQTQPQIKNPFAGVFK